jgi:hypothetical protein
MTNETQEIINIEEPIKLCDLKHAEEMYALRREHKTYITGKSIAKWNEEKQRYYYKPLDKEYEKKMYHLRKRDIKCEICGSIVVSQMYKHIKSEKCLMVKLAVQKALDNLNIEEAKLTINEISSENDLKQ